MELGWIVGEGIIIDGNGLVVSGFKTNHTIWDPWVSWCRGKTGTKIRCLGNNGGNRFKN